MGQSFGGASSQGPMAPPAPPPETGANTPNDTTPWYAKGYNAGGANDPMILQNALANLTDPNSAAGIFQKLASSFDALQQQQGGSAPIMSALDKGTTYTKFQQPEVAPPPAAPTPPAQQQPVQPWQPGGGGGSGGGTGGGGGGGAPSGGNTNAAPTQPAPAPQFPPGWEDTFSKQSPETQAAIQARYGNMSPDEIMKDWETNVAPRYAPGTDPGAILGGTAPIMSSATAGGALAAPPNLPAGWLDTYNNLPPATQAAINARYGNMSPDQIVQDWESNVVPNYAPGTSAGDILSGNTPATGGTNVSGHTTPGGAPSITGGATPYTTSHPGSANSAPTGFAGMRGNDANYYSTLGDAAKAGANSGSLDAAWDMPVHQEQGHYETGPIDPLTGKNQRWVPGKLRYAPGYGPGANMTSDLNTPVYWGVGKVPEMNAQGTNYIPQPLTSQQQAQVTQNAAPPTPPIIPPKPKPTGPSQFAPQTGF